MPALRRGPALSSARGAATSVKTIITIPCSASGSSSRWTVISTTCVPPLVPTLRPLSGDGLLLPERLLEGAGQFVAQPFAGHGEDVPVGLAGGRFQVFAGPPADVEDVALVVDQHGRRGVALQEQLVRQRLEIGRRFRHAGCASVPAGEAGQRTTGNSIGSAAGRIRVRRKSRDLPFSGAEEVGEAADGLRAAEKQDAAGIQAVVKERHEFLLQLRRQIDQQVAAAQDVQLGEGRVHDEVLRGKDHHLPDLLAAPGSRFLPW